MDRKDVEARNERWAKLDPVADRERWLEERQSVIGASEIMATVGMHPYMTPKQLQEEKLGLAPPKEETSAMRRGKLLEPVAVKLWEEETGMTTRGAPMRSHPEHPHVAATTDRMVKELEQPLEAKCLGYASFQKIRRNGLTDYIIGQVQVQAFVWDVDGTHLSVMHPDSLETLPFEVELDHDFVAHLVGNAEAWWHKHIINREPVEEGLTAGQEDVAAKLPKVKGEIVTRSDDPFLSAMQDLMDARDIRDEASALYTDAKERVAEVLGDELGVWESKDGRFRVYRSAQSGRAQYSRAFKKLASMDLFDASGERIDANDFLTRGSDFVTLRPYRLRAEGD